MDTQHPSPKHEGTALPDALASLSPVSIFLGYQQRALSSAAVEPLLLIEKSRRVGLTWALAFRAVTCAAAAADAGGKDFLYISYSQEMTREFIDACAMWARGIAGAAVELGEYLFDDTDPDNPRETRQIKAFRISFASGKEVVALSSAPRSLRGKQGVVCIDEAAFVDNLDELLKAAMAMLMWGGQVIVVSTHNGVDNPFNILLEEIKAGRRKGAWQRITFTDAMHDGLYERISLVTGKTPTAEGKLLFEADIRGFYGDDAEEELDCVPKAGAGCFLDPTKIAACIHPDAGDPTKYAGGPSYVGRDVAIRRDLSVIHGLEMVAPVLWLRERWLERGVSFRKQDEAFDRFMAFYRVVRAGIDQTGMGEKVVEDAILRFGDIVMGILMTPPNRLDLANSLKRRFDDETIRIPNDPALTTDLRAIKKIKGTGGAPRLVETGSEVHADEFWALAIACWLAEHAPIVFDFLSTGDQRGVDTGDGTGSELHEDRGFGVAGSADMTEGFF